MKKLIILVFVMVSGPLICGEEPIKISSLIDIESLEATIDIATKHAVLLEALEDKIILNEESKDILFTLKFAVNDAAEFSRSYVEEAKYTLEHINDMSVRIQALQESCGMSLIELSKGTEYQKLAVLIFNRSVSDSLYRLWMSADDAFTARRMLSSILEYDTAKGSYLVAPKEISEDLFIAVKGAYINQVGTVYSDFISKTNSIVWPASFDLFDRLIRLASSGN